MRIFLIIVVLSLPICASAQSQKDYARKGNNFYKKADFVKADSLYRLSVITDTTFYKAYYNSGNANYLLQNPEKAAEGWNKALKSEDLKIKSDATYNLGNLSMDEKNYAKAIEYYKEVLRGNPSDEEARYNLALAKKLLEEQQNQQNQDQNQQQNQQNQDQNQQNQQNQDQNQQQNQNQNQNQQNQQDQNQEDQQDQQDDQNDKDQDESDQQDSNQDQQQDKNDQNKNQQQQPNYSKQDRQRLLDAIAKEEEKTQEKVKAKQMPPAKRVPGEKDW